MNEITELKLTHNQRMDAFIAAVSTMTPEQIEACSWVMGTSGAGWDKEAMLNELSKEKFD